ncbi:MAG: hypothetical protein IM600_17310 [Bacteroidetes bacterium]|nr:hypothetical protein [Bacteroidota bacterium]MCA6445190.1 hypothetical protein [Bacteroidota bacterium]
MKKITVIIIALTSIMFIRCKKEYVCECGNPGGVYKTFTIKDTKKKALAKCVDKDAQDVPFSESYCNLK